MRTTCLLTLGFTVLLPLAGRQIQEPAPRKLAGPVATYEGDLNAVSGARELADGRVLLSDSRSPSLLIADLHTGRAVPLAREGRGPDEYLEPGGIYSGRADTAYVLDRALARVLLVTGDGRIAGTRSIRQQGVSGGTSADVDLQQIDVAGLAYFLDPAAVFARTRMRTGSGADSAALMRFDATRQRADTVARLLQVRSRVTSAEGQMVRSQRELFGAEDAWAVAPSGRVAVVRAAASAGRGRSPAYRVDWIEPDGRVTQGEPVQYSPLAVTAGDREAVIEAARGSTLGISGAGNATAPTRSASEPWFADSKPPFLPAAAIVGPDERVWVRRSVPSDERSPTVYDVFDGRGTRVDRIELPPRSRIVGFGQAAIYVSELSGDDLPRLRKYVP